MTSLALRVRAVSCLAKLVANPVRAVLIFFVGLAPAWADVEVRVEARPLSEPIQVFVKVTDAGGNPVPGLTADDFTVREDGVALLTADLDLTLPPSLDPNQHVSVVFAMDYSASVVRVARAEMEAAVINFIGTMVDGDFAAIIKFNATNPAGASVVVPFTKIDSGAGNPALIAGVQSDYPGNGTNTLDALMLALNHMVTPPAPLPDGPKAVILVGDGGDSGSAASEEDVVALANENSVPIFTIGVGDFASPGRTDLLDGLATESGGEFFPAPDAEDIEEAYTFVADLLSNEYLIAYVSAIADCGEHEIEVEVPSTGDPTVSVPFTRRVCDTEPDPFSFTARTGLAPSTGATSNTVTITGIEVPAHISIISGTYSIGCTDEFTNDPDTIEAGDTVCVRHQTSAAFSTDKTTTLWVGGFAATFTTTTGAQGGGGGGDSGGGGATGLFELLLGFAALLFGRRRMA